MPLVAVTCSDAVSEEIRRAAAAALPHRRAERVRADVQEVVGSGLLVGVYLRLPVAGWAQSP